MGTRSPVNITWAIISVVVVGNIFLFQTLFNNVKTYSDKVVSTKKYELEDI